MLDDLSVIQQKDPQDYLGYIAKQPSQLTHNFNITGRLTHRADITNIVFDGMGGSALVAEFVSSWPKIEIPFVICKGYVLPEFINQNTLVVCGSYSGNTEETIQAFEQALVAGCKVAVVAHAGKLVELARVHNCVLAELPQSLQPRAAVFYAYRAIVQMFAELGIIGNSAVVELHHLAVKLERLCLEWSPAVPESRNLAKQVAQKMVGKTPIIYSGPLMQGAAYKWKISINENAKNTAWCNQYPEFNHNEFIGWSSHPVDKPFAVINLLSDFEHPRVIKRFQVSEKLLSGRWPAPVNIWARGDTALEQLLYLTLLGDYAATYMAILNGNNPTPVDLVERFKAELAK